MFAVKQTNGKRFQRRNVLGLPGHVFGAHWHQRTGPKVATDHQDWLYDVRIRWPRDYEKKELFRCDHYPVILSHDIHWVMFTSDLSVAEQKSRFPILEHCRKLVGNTHDRTPVILEWGCGAGNAVRDLTSDSQIKGKALVFGYGDVWDASWNGVKGAKFLFFVKEHLAEYFRRMRLKIDFIFTHGGLETQLHGEELIRHIRDLATVMVSGGIIVFPTCIVRPELLNLNDLFQVQLICSEEIYADAERISGPYLLTKK